MASKNILVLTTGGTIAGNVSSTAQEDRGDLPAASVDSLGIALESTLTQIEELWGIAVKLTTVVVASVDSSDILPKNWVDLADQIHKNYDRFDGFIITHGTNTMGYTAAALSFALSNIGKAVVVTGSQVPFGWPGSDALMNLENAVRVAAWPHEGGVRGVVCVFGSHIITGTRAKKNTEFDYDAFQSFSTSNLGRIGRIIDVNSVNLEKHHRYLSRGRPAALRAKDLVVEKEFNPSLVSLTEFPGMDSEVLTRLLASCVERPDEKRLRGVIFRAFGAGDVSTHLHDSFRYLKESEIPVVVTTQAPNGNSNLMVNEPGHLMAEGKLAIPAYDMSIESITTKMMWLVGRDTSYLDFYDRMVTDLRGEVNVYVERR